jgi:hypothetical protein
MSSYYSIQLGARVRRTIYAFELQGHHITTTLTSTTLSSSTRALY